MLCVCVCVPFPPLQEARKAQLENHEPEDEEEDIDIDKDTQESGEFCNSHFGMNQSFYYFHQSRLEVNRHFSYKKHF